MKCYYCHECGKNFVVPEIDDPACVGCGSEFVELVNVEESQSVGGGASLAAHNVPANEGPFSVTTTTASTTNDKDTAAVSSATTSSTGPTTATAATNTTGSATTSTAGRQSGGASRAPINITIGSSPIFRGGLFSPFTAGGGGGGQDGRESPMDTNGEDPGDEVLSAAQLRRRHTSQVTGGARDPSIGVFPGGMYMVSQSTRGGPSRQSLGQMIHQHIQNVMEQREEQTDSGSQNGEAQQQQQQQQPPQQQHPGLHPQGHPPSATGGEAGGANHMRGNVRVINFPSVQVMMSQGAVGGQPHQQQATGGGAQAGASQGAGPANPQLPQFGMPMFFGLPLGPLMGIHGSPSDYAWGPQGLENIISQMLANLEDDGPPPTKKEKLDTLLVVQATKEELIECSLCSVCKDDFTLGESLVKLPCSHLYHRDCVMPWLEMHDTCPTCRFHINTEKYDDERTSV